jgi:endonuclease G
LNKNKGKILMNGYNCALLGELLQKTTATATLFALLTTFFLFTPIQAKVENIDKNFNKQQSANILVSTTVVISQFQVAGGNAADEFIELHNVSNSNVDLNGYRLVYRSASGTTDVAVVNWTASTIIPAGGYYLITNTVGYDDTVTPNITFTSGSTGAFSGTSGGFALRNGAANTGTIIDSVGYGTATNAFVETTPTSAPASNASKARNAAGCTDTDNNANDFSTLATSEPRNAATTPTICGGNTSTNPAGTGSANPSSVAAGSSTLLTVTVTPGTNPASTGITVTGNLSAIGGSASQQFFDDGTNGDVTAGDNIYSYNATVTVNTTSGSKNIPVTITDAQSRTGSATITLTVTSSSTSPTATGASNPSSVQAGGSTLLTVSVTPGTDPTSTGITVTGNLSLIGGAAAQTFYDDGTNGDVTAGDNIFSYLATVGAGTSSGSKNIAVTVTDAQSRTANTSISVTVTAAPTTAQPLPFMQDWSNTNLIAVNDDWSGVPGIVGYRGDNLTADTGTDPQTILADGSSTPINVIANQTNPDTLTSGGVAEFEIANPVVALQGSGTADAPHIVINVNTTGQDNITISYNIRDIDGSADNAAQAVALQYRIGSTGNYTNVPAAFVADATTANQATQVTAVNVALPAAVNNQSLVQIRIITANAVGNDEWIGIDDINIVSGGTIPLSGSGSASPTQVETGSTTLLKVSVNPGTNPSSTGITVTGNLINIGGSSTQAFYDDGTNGDQVAGDNVFSYLATVAANTTGGTTSLPVTITDAQNRTANTSVTLTVIVSASPSEHLVMGNPSGATTDVNNPFNYLLLKNQYVMSYHRDRGIPNWVSWHLDSSWLGSAPRQNDFRPDESLPADWYRVTEFSYSGSGFDRGHHTPSADRTRSIPDNSATFFMTNMMPQAPGNNQGPWEKLESYSRTLVGQGNELYILMGGVGSGGTGDNGFATTIDGGRVTVPAYTWKVIIILPVGDNDVSRVTSNTRTIAVYMPNNTNIRPDEWQKYITTVDAVEAITGYDFFSNVDPAIQAQIESRIDPANAPTAANVSVSGRVITQSGRGVRNVQIRMTDSNGNTRTAQTSTFGYYRFENVEAGETVVLSAQGGKRYTLAQTSLVRTVNEQISDADFVVVD